MNADAFHNEKISTDKNEILNIGSLFNLKFRKSIIVRISRIIFPQTRPDLKIAKGHYEILSLIIIS